MMEHTDIPPQMLTERQMSDYLQVSRRTLAELRNQGMPYTRINRAIRYDIFTVRTWLDRRT